MNGTTLCPHCHTRFRIAGEQLEAHQGMVRCGHCMQAFDARPGFIPDQPDPQLELPIVDPRTVPAVKLHGSTGQVIAPSGAAASNGKAAEEPEGAKAEEQAKEQPQDRSEPAVEVVQQAELTVISGELPHDGSLDFVQAANDSPPEEAQAKPQVLPPTPLTSIEEGEEIIAVQLPARRRPWVTGSSLLAFLLLLQAMYFFRVELAARLPGLKPLFVGYCNLLGCTVQLPQKLDLMSIESSELEADPEHANQITLVALLRNRASHVQAFPVLELSLNDTQDKVLARRQFKPADYLPATESEAAGLRPNRELNIRLKLDTTDLRPTGYRLALYYPQ